MSEIGSGFNDSFGRTLAQTENIIAGLSPEQPVLIAGPTASGKSALAMKLVAAQGGVIVNADALQVFGDWRVLTARPSAADEAALPHRLYGHVPGDQTYSVGHWLRDLAPLLDGARPVIVGGTGLYFAALTEGLAEIPEIPQDVRAEGAGLSLDDKRASLDTQTLARIDTANPMRVTRAWEVQRATGKGLAQWHAETPAPLLPLAKAQPLVMDAPKDWLDPRIALRFDLMVDGGALDEARANAPNWSPDLPSAKAIGAKELIAHVTGTLPLQAAKEAAVIATRQYAKRQRTWFRARMRHWTPVSLAP